MIAAADLKQILNAVSRRVESAPPVVAKLGKAKAEPLRTLGEISADILAIEKEADYEGLLSEIISGRQA